MQIHIYQILLIALGGVVVTTVFASTIESDDYTVRDTTNNDGTALTLATSSGEASFLFSHEGSGDAWRLRVQPSSEGLSIVKVGVGEKIRFLQNGDIQTTGNIIPSGDICIGNCP